MIMKCGNCVNPKILLALYNFLRASHFHFPYFGSLLEYPIVQHFQRNPNIFQNSIYSVPKATFTQFVIESTIS